MLRWPGGWFAAEYHWKDDIGPREKRLTMINTHWDGGVENNRFGTRTSFAATTRSSKTYTPDRVRRFARGANVDDSRRPGRHVQRDGTLTLDLPAKSVVVLAF